MKESMRQKCQTERLFYWRSGLCKDYGPGVMWLPGEMVSCLGSTMYEVQLMDGRKVRKHADQLRSRIQVVPAADDVGGESDSEID